MNLSPLPARSQLSNGLKYIKSNFCMLLFLFIQFTSVSSISAQALLFDFNSASQFTPLPINQTVGGLTAHFSYTGQGYSIQSAGTMGFTPAGFSGLCIYPSSVFLADLLINFDQNISDFSILYACQELGCDDAETMRITAFLNGTFVGTNTRVATFPGTWPSDTLSFNATTGFDSVVIHYDSPPPTCADYGVIYLADNMEVTINPNSVLDEHAQIKNVCISNPVQAIANISFQLEKEEDLNISIFTPEGILLHTLFKSQLNPGNHKLHWNVSEEKVKNGIYFLTFNGKNFKKTYKLLVLN